MRMSSVYGWFIKKTIMGIKIYILNFAFSSSKLERREKLSIITMVRINE